VDSGLIDAVNQRFLCVSLLNIEVSNFKPDDDDCKKLQEATQVEKKNGRYNGALLQGAKNEERNIIIGNSNATRTLSYVSP